MGLELLKTAASLLGVVGLIFLIAYVFRRFGLSGVRSPKDAQGWRVLGVKALSPGKQIFAMECGNKIIIIGTAEKTIASIAELHDAKDIDLIREALKPGAASFGSFLRKAES